MRMLLRLPDVRRIVGLSKSEIYRRISLGQFPKPCPLGDRLRAWDSLEITRFVEERIAAREGDSATASGGYQ